jgi:hypothetical protein
MGKKVDGNEKPKTILMDATGLDVVLAEAG